MNRELQVSLLSIAILLSACGSGSDDSQEEAPQKTLLSGVFIDSQVANLSYQTESQAGTTNIHGEFNYLEGENITFSIGELNLPTVKASGVITPMTLAGNPSVYHPMATNIAMLLQSLDEDGVVDGGISIPLAAREIASNTLDFSVPTSEFVTNANVINLVANGGAYRTSLITASSAQTHMQASLNSFTPYIGAWSSVADNQESYLVLFADNTFIYAENDAVLPNGLETGNYSVDSHSGDLTLTITYDNNGPGEDSGAGDIGTDVTTDTVLSNGNNTLSILNGGIALSSENLAGSSIVGSWSPVNNTGDLHMIFFANNTFLIADSSSNDPNGLQLGSYSYDSSTKGLVLSLTYNDTGDSSDIGNTNSEINMNAELSDNGNTLSMMNGGLILTRSL